LEGAPVIRHIGVYSVASLDDGWAQILTAMEAVGFDGLPHGILVNAQFAGDGADFPMLRVKVTTNLDVRFWIDHLDVSLDRGIGGKDRQGGRSVRRECSTRIVPAAGRANSGLSALILGSHIRMVPEK
jgi:hypothetical protein